MRISFVGSGNVATHLAIRFIECGHQIIEIFSRNPDHAKELAQKTGAVTPATPQEMNLNIDLLIMSISDDQLECVIPQLPVTELLVVHTAGSINMDILDRFPNHGVFYPFQTFSKQKPVDFTKIQVLIEANSLTSLEKLRTLGQSLTENVISCQSNQRLYLHIAAVLSCNFVNHLYTLSDQLLKNNQLSFDLLKPLIAETTAKLDTMAPFDAQTGPAVRNDMKIIAKHIELLKDNEQLSQIYQLLSQSIMRRSCWF